MKIQNAIVIALGVVHIAGPAIATAQVTGDRGRNTGVLDRPRPEYDAAPIRVGAFEWAPRLTTRIESNSNVLYADSGRAKSDTIITLAPTIDLNSTWSRHGFALQAGVDSNFHSDFSRDDRTNTFIASQGRIDIGASTAVNLALRYADERESRAFLPAPEQAAGLGKSSSFTGSAGVVTTVSRVRLSAEASSGEFTYDPVPRLGGGAFDQRLRDRKENRFSGRIEYALSPDTALLAQASSSRVDFRELGGPTRDYRNTELLAGANFDVASLMRGEIAIGWLQQENEAPGVASQDGLGLRAAVDWFPSRTTTIGAFAARANEPSWDPRSASAETTTYGANLNQEVRRNLLIGLRLETGSRDYRGIDRSDAFVRTAFNATYLINRRLRLGAGVDYTHETSGGRLTGPEYAATRALVSLTFQP
jgi:hypothetical protein